MTPNDLHSLVRRRKAQAPQFAIAILASAGLLNASAVLAQEAAPPATQASGPATAPKAAAKAAEPASEAEPQTVIVTGTVGATEAKRANVSYSVLDAKDLGKFTPMSADDYLRDMPGVVVESNEGVVRNEVYTRGMSVGTGSPTTANFWSSVLEDGLPVVPVKWNNFQDSNFFRADIGTSRVEGIRGGSAGTSLATSAGAVFNYLPGPIKSGSSIQTRLGFEGEDPSLSWKQVDALHGWRSERGDLRASIAGFYRTSNGTANPGYPLNKGGQVKARVVKTYESAGGGSGSFSLTLKHLDDNNGWMGQFTTPSHGYVDPVPAPGFIRGGDMYMKGGQHTVRTDAVNGPGSTKYHDPTKPAEYKQDAAWLKWEHDTGGRWSFSSAIKAQKSLALLQQAFYNAGPASLWSVASFQDAFLVNQGVGTNTRFNLNRQPGVYELYDRDTGTLRARIANNAGQSSGINYRTNAACAAGRSDAPAQCVTFTNLPNRDFDVGGGLVNGKQVPLAGSESTRDVVYITNSNYGNRLSKDLMLDFSAAYAGDNFRLQGGLFIAQANQSQETYFNGRGISAFESGNIRNLGVRYITGGNTYQLTDEGGWGRVGGGNVDAFTAYLYKSRERNIQPMFAAAWSPGKWDLNGSYKGTLTLAKTHTIPLISSPDATGANGLNYGGLDGNKLTWYDNVHHVRDKQVDASKRVYLKNYSVSVGYNVTQRDKIYYRHSLAGNNITGIINRYQNQFNADNKPLFPQVDLKQDEAAYVFANSSGSVTGQVTVFRTEMQEWIQQTPSNVDGSVYVLEYLKHFVSKGVEGWMKWRITPKLQWQTNVLRSMGRTLSDATFAAGAPGPEDDVINRFSGLMARTPKWVLSNTVSYEMGDFRFNLRHRYMAKRKTDSNPVNSIFLPQQRNTDFSIQYAGIKNVQISLDVRNVLNDKYISGFGTLVSTSGVTGVTASDVMAQLPNSASWNGMNAPRSFWLTARYNF